MDITFSLPELTVFIVVSIGGGLGFANYILFAWDAGILAKNADSNAWVVKRPYALSKFTLGLVLIWTFFVVHSLACGSTDMKRWIEDDAERELIGIGFVFLLVVLLIMLVTPCLQAFIEAFMILCVTSVVAVVSMFVPAGPGKFIIIAMIAAVLVVVMTCLGPENVVRWHYVLLVNSLVSACIMVYAYAYFIYWQTEAAYIQNLYEDLANNMACFGDTGCSCRVTALLMFFLGRYIVCLLWHRYKKRQLGETAQTELVNIFVGAVTSRLNIASLEERMKLVRDVAVPAAKKSESAGASKDVDGEELAKRVAELQAILSQRSKKQAPEEKKEEKHP